MLIVERALVRLSFIRFSYHSVHDTIVPFCSVQLCYLYLPVLYMY